MNVCKSLKTHFFLFFYSGNDQSCLEKPQGWLVQMPNKAKPYLIKNCLGGKKGKLPSCQFFEQLQFLLNEYDPSTETNSFVSKSKSASTSTSSASPLTSPGPTASLTPVLKDHYRESSKRRGEALEKEMLKSLKSLNQEIQRPPQLQPQPQLPAPMMMDKDGPNIFLPS